MASPYSQDESRSVGDAGHMKKVVYAAGVVLFVFLLILVPASIYLLSAKSQAESEISVLQRQLNGLRDQFEKSDSEKEQLKGELERLSGGYKIGVYQDAGKISFEHIPGSLVYLIPGYDLRSYRTLEFVAYSDDGTLAPLHLAMTYERPLLVDQDGFATFNAMHEQYQATPSSGISLGQIDNRRYVRKATSQGTVIYYIEGFTPNNVYRIDLGVRYDENSGLVEKILETMRFGS